MGLRLNYFIVLIVIGILSYGGRIVEGASGSWTSESGDWSASWVVDATVAKTINFTVTCQTIGWCGLGIANKSSMIGGDMYWATIGDTYCQSGCFSDRFAYIHAEPSKDNHTDINPISAQIDNGVFTWSFWRLLETGDLKQDNPIIPSGNWLLFAYGSEPGTEVGNGDYSFDYHDNRGYAFVNFYNDVSGSPTPTMSLTATPSPSTGSSVSPSPSTPPNLNPNTTTNSSFTYTNPEGTWSVKWELNDPNITFTVTCLTSGWCGLGLNPNSDQMPNTEVFWASVDSNQCSSGCFSNRFATEFAQPGQQSSQLIHPISAQVINGAFTWKFSRPIAPTTKTTRQSSSDFGTHYNIEAGEPLYLLWAYSGSPGTQITGSGGSVDYSFGQHSNRGAASVNFFSGSASTVTNNLENYRRAHSILMYVAWLFIVPFAVFLSRYMKLILGVAWYRLHVALNCFAVLLSFAAFGIIIYYTEKVIDNGDTKKQHFDGGHQALGLVLIIGTLIQPSLGVVADRLWTPGAQWKGLQDWVHMLFGRAMLIVGFVQIGLGIQLYCVSKAVFGVYITTVGIWILFLIVMEVLRWFSPLGKWLGGGNVVTKRGEKWKRACFGQEEGSEEGASWWFKAILAGSTIGLIVVLIGGLVLAAVILMGKMKIPNSDPYYNNCVLIS